MAEMMFSKNRIYTRQIENAFNLKIDWEQFRDKVFFITGASGLIGTFLVDLMMYTSAKRGLGIKVYAACRSEEKAKNRFPDYWSGDSFYFLRQDVNSKICCDMPCDYIIHGASNTHPAQYAADPIGTIAANVIGTQNLLEFATLQSNPRVMFLSSVEVYGENRGDIAKFDESYCGYIDCNTLRAGYPESKRLGEAMCQAYKKAKNLYIVMPRLSRVYGPTMSQSDSKAIAQFIRKAVNREDIVLKSKGEQLYSYTYVADAAAALLYILLYGENGGAYNVSGDNSDITLREVAQVLSEISRSEVVFELPSETEAAGYSKATKAVLDNGKLKDLGWESRYDMRSGLESTVEILRGKC